MNRSLVAAVVAVFVLGGCSSDAEPAPSSSDTSSPAAPSSGAGAATTDAPAGDPGDLVGLALGAEDFPEPYTYVEVPPEARAEAAGATDGGPAGALIDPPECGRSPLTEQDDLTNAGLAVATSPTGSSLIETITPVVVPLSTLSDFVATCAEYRIELPGQDGLTAETSVSEIDAPEVEGAETAATRATTGGNVDGTDITFDTVTYIAQLDDVLVTVVGTAVPGEEFDVALLDDLFVTGVEKVRNGR